MRFVFYNMRYGSGTGPDFHFPFPMAGYLRNTRRNVDLIAQMLKGFEPDIVGLVEIDCGSVVRTGRQSQAETIASELGHYHCYRSKYGPTSLAHAIPIMGKQGNALLTKESVRAVRCHYFRKGIKRLVLDVDLGKIRVFLVHLSLKYRHRQEQLDMLYELVKHVNQPLLVGGDFNVFKGEQELNMFLAATGLRNASHQNLPSFPSWSPRRQLDFILHSPELKVTGFEVPCVRLSDHFPLVCDFRIRG